MPHGRVFLILAVSLILISSLLATFPRSSSAGDMLWSAFNIPSEGVSGNWLLAAGSDVRCLTRAADGALYCYADPHGTPFRFFKSTDEGRTWSYSGRVQSVIVDIAASPLEPGNIYYATASSVFKSVDSGDNFQVLAPSPGGAGENGLEITSIDVTSCEGFDLIAVSVRDTDNGQFGGIYILDQSRSPDWADLEIGSHDACCVVFSPSYSRDRQIVAVISNETDVIVAADIDGLGWGCQAGNAVLSSLPLLSASVVFPDDYEADLSGGHYVQFIAVDSGEGQGGVYRLTGRNAPQSSELLDLNLALSQGLDALDITGLAVKGEASQASLMAVAPDAAGVYSSEDGGCTWNLSVKHPSGSSGACVLMDRDYASSRKAYAATCGTESAFSLSKDGGATWNQTGLVDSRITHILDLAVSPAYASDSTLFLLTQDFQYSLWISKNAGLSWERIFSSTLPSVERIERVLVSPSYQQNSVIYLKGVSQGQPVIWKSADSGRTYSCFQSVDPQTGEWVNIDAWAVSAEDELFVGSYDGQSCLVYQTGKALPVYIDKAAAGSGIAVSLALSPNFSHDQVVILGNSSGSVYYSNDHGRVFEPLPAGQKKAPFEGPLSVAFDSGFVLNNTVYAADKTRGKGIFRFIIGTGQDWEAIDGTLPQGAGISHIAVSDAGVLYAVYARNEINIANKSGLERSLDPALSSPFFESVTAGLADGIELDKLWVRDNIIWSVDIVNTALMVYTDLMDSSVELDSPPDGAAGLEKSTVQISWHRKTAAEGYQWQIDTDSDFVLVPDKYQGETDSLIVNLPSLDSNTLYYWRVRANAPVAGPWSQVRLFDTIPGLEAPSLSSPSSSSGSSVEPVFRWSASEGAECYDLLVAGDEAFSIKVIDRSGDQACPSNVWKCVSPLEYETTYYWKVRARCGERLSNWSSVGIFTTQKKPSGSSSGGGGGGGGSSPVKTPAPTTSPVQTPLATLSPAASPAPGTSAVEPANTAIPSSQAFPAPSAGPSMTATPLSPAKSTKPAATVSDTPGASPVSNRSPEASTATPTSPDPNADTGETGINMGLIITLFSILAVLLVVLGFAVFYLYKKFKRF